MAVNDDARRNSLNRPMDIDQEKQSPEPESETDSDKVTCSTSNVRSSRSLSFGEVGVNSSKEVEQKSANEREITQTDHLNKKLLHSFLQRMNAPNSGIPVVSRLDTDPLNDDEFLTTDINQNL